jgi:hypothetical protein
MGQLTLAEDCDVVKTSDSDEVDETASREADEQPAMP